MFEHKELKIDKKTKFKDLNRGVIALIQFKTHKDFMFIYGIKSRPKKAISLTNPNFYFVDISSRENEVLKAFTVKDPDPKSQKSKSSDSLKKAEAKSEKKADDKSEKKSENKTDDKSDKEKDGFFFDRKNKK